MAITVTLEGEEEAIVSALVDAALFPSALAAVQGAVRRLGAEAGVAEAPTTDDESASAR